MSGGRVTHGMSHRRPGGSPTYTTWSLMLQRCNNPKNTNYSKYGVRGISVCEKWRRFAGFFEDMGERPAGMTLDRIDVNGNYEPGNCRWATRAEQMRNTTRTAFEPHEPDQVRWLHAEGHSPRAISLLLGVGAGAVNHVIYGGGWK